MAAESEIDPLEDLLDLENQYHKEGYNLGVEDGSRAGRIEGRIFGVEKGFEKYVQMGRLNGKATVWSARVSSSQADTSNSKTDLRPISGSERLKKHIHRLKDLTDPETLSTENSEDAVADFDDRLKDANAKAILISKSTGEIELASPSRSANTTPSSSAAPKAVRLRKDESGQQMTEMEDFLGLPGARKHTRG